MAWVPSSAWLTKIAHRRRACRSSAFDLAIDASGARRAVAGHGRPRPAGQPARARRGPSTSSARSRAWRSSSSAIGGILLLIRRRPPMSRRLTAAADPMSAPRRRPGRLVLAGSIALVARAGGHRGRLGPTRRGSPRADVEIADPLLALRARRVHACRPACPVRSCCATTTRSTTSGSSATRRSTSATGPAPNPSTTSRPTEVTIPAGATRETTVTFDDAGHVPVHLPSAGPRGVRDGRDAWW